MKLTDSEKEEIRKLRAEGLSYDRIGKIIGCHVSTVQDVIHPQIKEARKAAALARYHRLKDDPDYKEKKRKSHNRWYANNKATGWKKNLLGRSET